MQNLCKFLLKYIVFLKFVEFGNSKNLYVNHLSDSYHSKNTRMVEGRLGTPSKDKMELLEKSTNTKDFYVVVVFPSLSNLCSLLT